MRTVLALTLAAATAALGAHAGRDARQNGHSAMTDFSVVEASIEEMQVAMAEGRATARSLVEEYLSRIARYNDRLVAAIALHPDPLAEADRRDRERSRGLVRGPLHGIPIAIKDNIHTTHMPTTGGALVFAALVPPYEATITRRLRDAGAIILAKTTLTELANWVAPGMPAGYSALAGYGMNPYDPRPDPRPGLSDGRPVLSPGGSSSGIGTAANLWAASVGTETSGSILHPAHQTMIVGIKPTVGRISRHGIMPIAVEQDTAGPMTKTVADAAILLGVLEGDAPDPQDRATGACRPPPGGDYTEYLRADGLRGARIGIPRAYYYEPARVPGTIGVTGGLDDAERAVMQEAIAVLRQQGAEVVDPADIPSIVATDPDDSLLLWPICIGPLTGGPRDTRCSIVFRHGMKRDFSRWLQSLGDTAPVRTLAELRAWNRTHAGEGALKYGQAQLDMSDAIDLDADRARAQADREKDLRLAGREGLDAALEMHRLDALLFPGPFGAAIAARAGYPTIIVPFGTVPNDSGPPLPPGFDPRPAPFGVSLTGRACSEPRLIALAYAFEQATRRRVPPVLE